MREGRVLLVGIEAADCAGLIDYVLGDQRADERFADAAFGLEHEMNCVLHSKYLTSKVLGKCRAGHSQKWAAACASQLRLTQGMSPPAPCRRFEASPFLPNMSGHAVARRFGAACGSGRG